MDLTLRLWDFSPIRKKFVTSGAGKTGKHELYGNEVIPLPQLFALSRSRLTPCLVPRI